MTTTKQGWTAGPWELDVDTIFAPESQYAVARLFWDETATPEQERANARLIAAAPAMYEALEAALYAMQVAHNGSESCPNTAIEDCECLMGHAYANAQAALKLARGEQ